MKFLVILFIGIPAAIVLIALAVANRHTVPVSLDPTTTVDASPALVFSPPMWVLLFGVLVLGVVIGGIAAWASQHRYRREARRKRHEASHWHHRADEEHERAERLARDDAERRDAARVEAANDDAPARIRRRPLPALAAPSR